MMPESSIILFPFNVFLNNLFHYILVEMEIIGGLPCLIIENIRHGVGPCGAPDQIIWADYWTGATLALYDHNV